MSALTTLMGWFFIAISIYLVGGSVVMLIKKPGDKNGDT